MKSKKALIIIDVQTSFINRRNKYILKNIEEHISLNMDMYKLYITSFFKSSKNSIWQKQQGNRCPNTKEDMLHPKIVELLPSKQTLHLTKRTKSIFKSNTDLFNILKKHKVTEVHITGLQTNDCVFATAYESFDYGFVTYVIENCCESGTEKNLHTQAINLLRHQNMTDYSRI